MGENPLFTVFIPTIGRLNFFKPAIASARAQTYPNLEILVGDEMSNDGTHDFLLSIAAEDPRVRFYRSEVRLGMPGNWQRGLDMARGEFISIVSDDDILKPEFVERCVFQMLKDSSLDVISTLHEVIDETGAVNSRITDERDAFFREQLEGKQDCNVHTFPPMMSSTFRVGWARSVGFSTEAGLAADVDFFRRAGALGYRCYLIQERLVEYRVHSGAMSSSRVAEQGRGNLNSLLNVERTFPEQSTTFAWRELRSRSLYSLIHCLTRSGRFWEAFQLLFRHQAWLGWKMRLKCATRLLLTPVLSLSK